MAREERPLPAACLLTHVRQEASAQAGKPVCWQRQAGNLFHRVLWIPLFQRLKRGLPRSRWSLARLAAGQAMTKMDHSHPSVSFY